MSFIVTSPYVRPMPATWRTDGLVVYYIKKADTGSADAFVQAYMLAVATRSTPVPATSATMTSPIFTGSCTVACPAKRPLMQTFKQAKAEIQEKKKREGGGQK